ncbi:MAG: c-type cytochrome [Saprospiraceae bacterium]|nr:c-type cytochrome [Saprospiraceae bacterium]
MKSAKYLLTPLLVLASLAAWGQTAGAADAAAPVGADKLTNILTYVLAIAGSLLFIAAMVYVIKVNQFLYKRVIELQARESGLELPHAEVVPQGESFWTRMRRQYWEDAVPREREHEIMSHHAYDGIRELDNRLPPWWVNMFYLTIVFAIAYMVYYHWGGDGPSQIEEYEKDMEQAKKEMAVALAGQANAVDESNVTALTDASALGEGELIFKNSCAACHAPDGGGTVGPNFTDEYWIHGGGIKNIFKTVKYGVPEKGMIAWASQLNPSDMQKVSSYILTLQGTKPAAPKEPQGEIWKEDAAAAQDSTAIPATTTDSK